MSGQGIQRPRSPTAKTIAAEGKMQRPILSLTTYLHAQAHDQLGIGWKIKIKMKDFDAPIRR